MKAILTYHSIDESGSVISIPEATFRRHVAWLATGRVRVLPLEELAAAPDDADSVAITFDDGMESCSRIAAPLLRDHGLPATVFVVTDAVGSTNVWGGRGDPGIPVVSLLGWDALGELARGGVSVGAHTCSHPRLDLLDAGAIEREIVDSKARIARELGIEATTFAYPYGRLNAAARDVVAREFRYGVTTRLATLGADDDAARLPRLDSYYFRRADALESWGSTRFRVRMGLLAGARSVRRSLARSGGA
ncbi:MAG TPA: polysaccharide deacetylase family protein [Gemmatimonadaceae bacterium]|nr:polysaccharide deacetylase family protein [Gemmatimonadaceae bacterium]